MIEIPFLSELPPAAKEAIVRVALAVLAIALIWVMRRVVMGLIARPVNKWLESRSDGSRGKLAADILTTPVRLLVIALGLFVAAQILNPAGEILAFVDRLSRSFIIMAVAVGLVNAADIVIASSTYLRRITGIALDQQLVPFMKAALKVVVIALAIVIILQAWNYDVGGLIAGLGLAGLAFSLAAQETVSNLFGFGTIVSDRPFEVGEYIITPDVEGTVDSIGPRSTRIRRLDQAYVTIPNAKIANSAVTNWSRLQKRWINFKLGVTYSASSEDLRRLLDRLRAMLKSYDRADPDSVLVNFVEYGESSLNILIRLYIAEPDWNAFQAETEYINLQIMDIVEDLGLSIAFPSRSIYVESLPAKVLGLNPDDEQTILPTSLSVNPIASDENGGSESDNRRSEP